LTVTGSGTSRAGLERGVLAGTVDARPRHGAQASVEVGGQVGIAEPADLVGPPLRRVAVRVRLHAQGVPQVVEVLVDRRVGDARIGSSSLLKSVDHSVATGSALRLAVAL